MILPSQGYAGSQSARAAGTSTSVEFIYLCIQQNIFKMPGWGSRVKRLVPACRELIKIINSYLAKGMHSPLWEFESWRS